MEITLKVISGEVGRGRVREKIEIKKHNWQVQNRQ